MRQIGPAQLPGGRLYDAGGFPLLVEGGALDVKGCLLLPLPDEYDAILKRVDYLEQFVPGRADNVYRRVRRTAVGNDGRHSDAWVYVGDSRYSAGLPPIPDNDWAVYSADRASEIDRWWQNNPPGQFPFFPRHSDHE